MVEDAKEKDMEKKLKSEIYGTAHQENVIIIETLTEIQILAEKLVFVLNKLDSKFTILKRELVTEIQK